MLSTESLDLQPLALQPLALSPPIAPSRARRSLPPGRARTLAPALAIAGIAILGFVGVAWGMARSQSAQVLSPPEPECDRVAPLVPFHALVHGRVFRHRRHGRSSAVEVSISTTMAPPSAVSVEVTPSHHPSSRSAHETTPAADRDVPAETTERPAPAMPSTCAQRCNGDIDCVLRCPAAASGSTSSNVSASQSSQSYAAPETHNALVPPTPSREQVQMAMDRERGAMIVCGMGLPSTAPRTAVVTVTFDHSGAATGASVGGAFAGTSTGECITHAAERVRLPQFQRATFRVSYPFAVR